MPLEIRELVIKATVGDDAEEQPQMSHGNDSDMTNELNLDLIVERVLDILKEASGR